MEHDTPPSYRIGGTTEVLMMGFAWSIYALNFLVEIVGDWFGVGEIASLIIMIAVNIIFVLWFTYKSVSVFDPKIIWKFIISFIISSIPILNLFYFSRGKSGVIKPGFIARIKSIIENSREEDIERQNGGEGEGEKKDPRNANIWDGKSPKERHVRPEPREINTGRDVRDTTPPEQDDQQMAA